MVGVIFPVFFVFGFFVCFCGVVFFNCCLLFILMKIYAVLPGGGRGGIRSESNLDIPYHFHLAALA